MVKANIFQMYEFITEEQQQPVVYQITSHLSWGDILIQTVK